MKKIADPISLSLIALSIMIANSAYSEDTNVSEYQLDTVEIEARALIDDPTIVGSSVSTIDSDDIEQSLTRNLDDLVRYEPGVEASQDSRFGISDINIRGLDGNRVKISVDGVTQADSYGPTSTYLRAGRNAVDMDSLESVEIIKGGDVLEGSGALGGVVKYQTKEPSSFLALEGDDTSTTLKAGYKSASDEFNQTLTVANRTGETESLFVYTNRDGHETENYNGDAGSDQTVGDTRSSVDPADTGSDNFLFKVQQQLNSHNRVGLVGEYYESTSESTLFSESSSTNQHSSDDEITRSRVGLFHENTNSNTLYDRLKWQFDYQDTKTNNITYQSSTDRTDDRFYDEEAISFKVDAVKQVNAHQLRYGMNYDRKSLENLNKNIVGSTTTKSRFSPVADANIIGLYLEDNWAVTDKLALVPAIRLDSYKYKTTGDEYIDSWGDSSNEAMTAQLATEYEINESYTVFGKVGSGFRAPNLDELYYYYANPSGWYQITPNPDLEPEESLFFEAGIRAHNLYGEMELTAFYNDYKNFIEQVNLGTSTFIYGEYTNVNLDQVVIKGAEIKGRLNISKVFPSMGDGWQLNGAIAYAEGDDLGNNEPLDSISPLTAVVGLGYDAPSNRWGGQLNLTWTSGKDEEDITDSNQWLATSSYNLVDVTTYYKATNNLTINAGIFNLTDEEYTTWNDVRNITDNSTSLSRYTRVGRNIGIDATLTF